MKGVKVSNFIVPMGVTDTYPTNLDIFGRGGIHSVDTILNRDAITGERRSEGMLSFTKNNESMYALLGGVTNDKWFKLFDFTDNKVNFNIACDPNYVLLGNKDGVAKPSPRLRDMQFDIIALRRLIGNFEELKKLDHNRIWIGDSTHQPVEQLQIGIVNLPTLAEAVFPNPLSPIVGDSRIPNPTFDYLSPFDWVMSGPFLPQIYATKYDTFGNPTGTDVSSSLAMTQVRAAQIMKRFDNANFIVGSSTVDFTWENPKMYLIPEPLKQLYGLGTTYTFSKAQSLGALETGLLKNTVNNSTGTLSRAIPGKDYVDLAVAVENMQLTLIRPLAQDQQGNDISKLLTRISKLPEDNMPDLTFIMQRPSAKIPSAQGLSDLAGGMLKSAALTGVVSIASGGKIPLINDYVQPIDLQEEILETKAFATAEAAAAEVSAIASGIAYFTAQMLPFSLVPLVPVGASITAAIAVAVFSKESTADHDADISIINNTIAGLSINIQGEVLAQGKINEVISARVQDNLILHGEYVGIPKVNILPINPPISSIFVLEISV